MTIITATATANKILIYKIDHSIKTSTIIASDAVEAATAAASMVLAIANAEAADFNTAVIATNTAGAASIRIMAVVIVGIEVVVIDISYFVAGIEEEAVNIATIAAGTMEAAAIGTRVAAAADIGAVAAIRCFRLDLAAAQELARDWLVSTSSFAQRDHLDPGH